jgi:CHAT domain-containing protein/tetratricopeptide (TPR) repeat protein
MALMIILTALAGAALDAAAPPASKPPWQRLLQGKDARKAAELEKELARLQAKDRFEEALKIARTLADVRKKVQGADHWQAIDALHQVTAIQQVLKQNASERKDYAGLALLQSRADALEDKSHYRDAQMLREKVLAINRRVLGEEHPYTASSFSDLAFDQDAQGNYAKAELHHRKALTINRKVLGEEHPDTATSYNNLAYNQQARGELAQADAGYRKALNIWRKVHGEEHRDTARCYSSIAVNQCDLGNYAEAEAGHQKALAIRRKLLGEEDLDTANSYDNLAASQHAQDKYGQAEQGFRKALAIRRKLLGEKHPDTARSYNNLASNQQAQGRYAEAEQGLRKALAIRRNRLGEDHPETANSYNNLAGNLNIQGQYAQAEYGYRKALAIQRKLLGEAHPQTARSYNNLATNQHAQGKYVQAEEGFRKALAIFRKKLGEKHPEIAQCYNNLAVNLNSQGKFASAKKSYHQALDIYRKVLGEQNHLTAISYDNLANNYRAQGELAKAREGYRKALAIKCKVLGEEHPDTAMSFHNLASIQYGQGNYAEAEKGFRTALAIRRKALGEEHPDTVGSCQVVASTLSAQGKYAQAEDLWQRAADCLDKARSRIAASGLDRAAKTGELSRLPQLAAVLARNGKPEAAWQRFEQSLGRGTWDDLSTRFRRPLAERNKQAVLVACLDRLDQLIERTFSAGKSGADQLERRKELLTQQRQAQDELNTFMAHMEKRYGPVGGQVFDRAQIQAALPPDAAFVAWIDIRGRPKAKDPNGEHWAVLLRSAGAPVFVPLPRTGAKNDWTDADTRLPAELGAALQSNRSVWQPLAQRLGQQRLAPLAKYLAAVNGLPAVRHLIVLPSIALAGVPVEVFADGYTVSYALSGTMYAHLRRQAPPTAKGMLALGDPIFDRPDIATTEPRLSPGGEDKWAQLPGTRVEVEALRRLFGDRAGFQLLFDSDASEQRLHDLAEKRQLNQYRYLHLATHGEVDNRMPLRSTVILSRDHLPDPGKQLDAGLPIFDGRLTAQKVLESWHLDSELVTLSACQSALGKYEGGEGFVGFAQALILCGSRSVCLSLWKVDDTATALLMERFYQNLLGKREGLKAPLAKGLALAEAKAWLRRLPREQAVQQMARLGKGVARAPGAKELPRGEVPAEAKGGPPYAHPYYWAAFVLIGDER